MSIKQSFFYFYYILYKVWLKVDKGFGATGPFPTNAKAFICTVCIEILLLFSIAIYSIYFLNIHVHLPPLSLPVLMPFIILYGINWFIFEKDDRWKDYVKEFDGWPPKKNRTGAWIVVLMILFIILNFIYSLYLNPPPGGLKW